MRLLMWRFRDSLNPEWGGRENAITTKVVSAIEDFRAQAAAREAMMLE